MFPSLKVTSQEFTIKGQIKSNDNEAHPFTSVFLENTNDATSTYGTVANDLGKFEVSVACGDYAIRFSVAGTRPKTLTIDARQ